MGVHHRLLHVSIIWIMNTSLGITTASHLEFILQLICLLLQLISLGLSSFRSAGSRSSGLASLYLRLVLDSAEHTKNATELLLSSLYGTIDSIANVLDERFDASLGNDVADADFVEETWAAGWKLGFGKTVYAEISTEPRIRPCEVFCGSVGGRRVSAPVSINILV